MGGREVSTVERPEAVRWGGLPAHIARRIIADAHARGVAPGEPLADESRLIEQYGVSRGTLREALRLLSFLGAITIKAGPGGGARLSHPGPAVVGSALGMVVQFRGATLRAVFEARSALEPGIASLAALHRTDSDLARLDRSVVALRAAEDVPGYAYAEQSGLFHNAVADASHNEVLATVVPALVAMTSTVRWRYPRGGRKELTGRIAVLIAAIRDRDAPGAATATATMFRWVMDDLDRNQRTALESRILWPDVDAALDVQRHGPGASG
ncbi:FadR/GntR family transcriptional regulator [Pseudonocardia sp. H11422]|uniref:FadR/GntR family transcriptional regulator n=1 Tax=Pseudonocardia sp. H11422 TaxID=2835866 RepID=UPI001BDD6655|nr:FCD domain-containing protein [Pseudonocardia sp. H11422]